MLKKWLPLYCAHHYHYYYYRPYTILSLQLTLIQGHREFPFGNSREREFPGIADPQNSRREFPGISEILAELPGISRVLSFFQFLLLIMTF